MAQATKNKSAAGGDSRSATPASPSLEVFAQNLLVEKGAYKLDAQTVAMMKKEILERLDILINKVAINALNDDEVTEFNKLIDQKAGSDVLQKYITDHVPDLQDRITEALYRFRITYLGIQ